MVTGHALVVLLGTVRATTAAERCGQREDAPRLIVQRDSVDIAAVFWIDGGF